MVCTNAPAEEAVLDLLEHNGPCYLDDLAHQLPDYCWSQVFLAVDRMSRKGILLLHHLTPSAYLVSLSQAFRLPFTYPHEGTSTMTLPPMRFCGGCGHVFDELMPSACGPSWMGADVFREKYGFGFDCLTLLDDACPPCAKVFAIGRRQPLRVPTEKLVSR